MTTLPERHVHVGSTAVGELFATIRYVDGRLSITHTEAPRRDGNANGSAGAGFPFRASHLIRLADGITDSIVDTLNAYAERWHLNDLRAGTPAQMEHLRHRKSLGLPVNYDAMVASLAKAGLQPDGDYQYGSGWLREDVPAEVLDFLAGLPTASHPWDQR